MAGLLSRSCRSLATSVSDRVCLRSVCGHVCSCLQCVCVCVCVCMRCVCICVCVSCRLLSTCALTKCCGVTCPTYYIVDKLRCFTHLLRHSLKIPHNSPIFCLTLSKSRYFPQLYSSVQALIICVSLMFPGCPLHLTKVPPSSSLS